MIEPTHLGPRLIDQITSTLVSSPQVAVWRLGQAGVVFRFAGGATVVVDPYLSNHCEAVLASPFDHRRLTRSPLDGSELAFANVIACTHDHLDHLDPPTVRSVARLEDRPALVAPRTAKATFEELGWTGDDVVLTDDGEEHEVAGLTVTALAVPHESFDAAEEGHPYLGYVFSDGRTSVAHLGDCLDHERVRLALQGLEPDVMFVPINGRNESRAQLGFAGNMTAKEAVELVCAVGSPVVVPVHYDMFAQNVDADCVVAFVGHANQARLSYHVLDVGETATIEPNRRQP